MSQTTSCHMSVERRQAKHQLALTPCTVRIPSLSAYIYFSSSNNNCISNLPPVWASSMSPKTSRNPLSKHSFSPQSTLHQDGFYFVCIQIKAACLILPFAFQLVKSKMFQMESLKYALAARFVYNWFPIVPPPPPPHPPSSYKDKHRDIKDHLARVNWGPLEELSRSRLGFDNKRSPQKHHEKALSFKIRIMITYQHGRS